MFENMLIYSQNNLNTKNDAWENVFMINAAHKNCHTVYQFIDVIRRSNQLTYSVCSPICYYDSSDIKFDTVMKM